MKTVAKVAVVAGGYLLAGLVAYGVVAAYVASTSGPDRNSSAGMYAFGDGLYFLGVFAVAAVPATAAAAWFVRPYRQFWRVFAAIAIALAATGVLADFAYFLGRTATRGSPAEALAEIAVLRILIAPLLSLLFLLAGLFAPERSFKLRLLGAGLVEGVVFVAVASVWFFQR